MSTTEDSSSGAGGRVQQAPGLWRTDLQQHDLSAPGNEVVQARVDIGPEAPVVKHTIPAQRSSTSSKGRWSTRSTANRPRPTTPGEALTVPAGVVHAVRNVGSRNAPELATYVVEKGQAAPHGGRVSKWTAGSMPCDGAWSEEQVARIEEWVAAGKPA